MSLITSPIDDTLQLSDMATSPDVRNLNSFPESGDRVAIVQPNIRQVSQDHLITNTDDSDSSNADTNKPARHISTSSRSSVRGFTCRATVTVAILTLVNLLNYMDRFTIAGKNRKICPFNHCMIAGP